MVKVAKASSSMAQPRPKPHCLNKSTVTSSTAEPVLNAPMLSTTTRSKPCCLNTSGGASSVAEPVPNTLQPSMSTLVTQPRPCPQKCHSLNQSGVPSTNPVDGTACDSMDNDSDDFFIVSHVCGSILEKSDTSSESFVPETPMRRDENTPRLQPYVATSQAGWGSMTPVCTYSKRHPKVVIPRCLNKMFGQPHGHSHTVSVELDPVVGHHWCWDSRRSWAFLSMQHHLLPILGHGKTFPHLHHLVQMITLGTLLMQCVMQRVGILDHGLGVIAVEEILQKRMKI